MIDGKLSGLAPPLGTPVPVLDSSSPWLYVRWYNSLPPPPPPPPPLPPPLPPPALSEDGFTVGYVVMMGVRAWGAMDSGGSGYPAVVDANPIPIPDDDDDPPP
jgi:hypothetical protein